MEFSRELKKLKEVIQKQLPSKKKKGAEYDENTEKDTGLDSEDAAPGEQSMTDGEKDTTLGINKKIVNISAAAVIVVIAVAFGFNMMDSGDNQNDHNNTMTAAKTEQAADANMANRNNQTDYRNVQQQLQRANQEKTGANGQTNQNSNKLPANGEYRNNNYQQQQVPAIRSQPSYNTQYTLPSAMAQIDANARRNAPNQQLATTPAEASKAQEEKNIVDKFKSAIDFAIGGGGGAVSDTASNTSSAGSIAQTSTVSQSGYSSPSNQILQAGTIIPMMLHTGINTDNAGQVIAVVQSDVYDTATGTQLLIPMGSKVIGSYGAGANSQSDRVSVMFATIIYPNGASYAIGDSMIAVDEQGYNGIRGNMDKHMDAAVGRTLVNGILGAGFTALSTIGTNRANIDTSGLQNMLESSINISPTVTIDPGYEFNIFVTKPIVFSF